MQIFDTHCHYNLEPLYSGAERDTDSRPHSDQVIWTDHWQRAQEHQVSRALVVGADAPTSQRAIAIAEDPAANSQIWAAIGFHPDAYQDQVAAPPNIDTLLEQQALIIKPLLTSNRLAAIGETGLDYFRFPSADPDQQALYKHRQQAGFIFHLELALKTKLPVIIHCRDTGAQAYQEVLNLLTSHYLPTTTQPFVLHCISGPVDYVQRALSLGAYVSVAGNVTYPSAHHIRQLVAITPSDRLLLETDAPFLPPQGYRGQSCQPWMIAQTARYLKETAAIDLDQVWENACRVIK